MKIVNEFTEGQRLAMRCVLETSKTFIMATGHEPKVMYASSDFIREFGTNGFIGLELYGVAIQFDEHLVGFVCYANRAQLVD